MRRLFFVLLFAVLPATISQAETLIGKTEVKSLADIAEAAGKVRCIQATSLAGVAAETTGEKPPECDKYGNMVKPPLSSITPPED